MADPKVLMSIAEVETILSSGNFDPFIGIAENDHYDFKEKYLIGSTDAIEARKAISDLISDVASFANKEGGYILLNVDTDFPLEIKREIGKAVLKVSEKVFREMYGSIVEIVGNNVYPNPQIELRWYKGADDKTLGLGCIFVPPQHEADKPFLAGVVQQDGKVIKHFVGIPERKGDGTQWLKLDEVYDRIKNTPREMKSIQEILSAQIKQIPEQVASHLQKKPSFVIVDDAESLIKETRRGKWLY